MADDAPPVTEWIRSAEAGDGQAIAQLWEHFFPALLRVGRRLLHGKPIRNLLEPDDLANSAFTKFRHDLLEAKLAHLADRTHLWHLLVRNLNRKVVDHLRHAGRQKRNPGPLATTGPAESGGDLLAQQPGREPSPDYEAMLEEELARLETKELRHTAVLWMQGYRREEIATECGVTVGTVDRWLKRIRTAWKEDLQ